jgi:hypothetical protein
MTKSAKWRDRQRAFEDNRLHEWHAAQPASNAPDFSIQTLEAVSWSEDSRYPRWLLPVNAGRVVGGVPRNRF